MACESCQAQARSLMRVAMRAGLSGSGPVRSTAASSAATAATRGFSRHPTATRRDFGHTAPRRILSQLGSKVAQPYRVLGATERIFKICAAPADYRITEEERKKDEVKKLDDGEEVGHSLVKGNVWHTTFNLQPSFSTWSHVTMLHLYLFNARLRCFERDEYRNWQQQLVDHFFFQAEKKMHIDHNINSSALRQRYLKDIFVQWRGLLLAYDEGLIKGDAILASAVWRNLFKGSPDVDPRALVAIVGWMRASLKSLESASDANLPFRAEEILKAPVDKFWKRIEEPLKRTLEEAEETKTPEKEAPTVAGETPA